MRKTAHREIYLFFLLLQVGGETRLERYGSLLDLHANSLSGDKDSRRLELPAKNKSNHLLQGLKSKVINMSINELNRFLSDNRDPWGRVENRIFFWISYM